MEGQKLIEVPRLVDIRSMYMKLVSQQMRGMQIYAKHLGTRAARKSLKFLGESFT